MLQGKPGLVPDATSSVVPQPPSVNSSQQRNQFEQVNFVYHFN